MGNEHVAPQASNCLESQGDANLAALRADLMRYCDFLCGSRQEAEDIVQTTLMKALPILSAKKHNHVPALLRRIAKNTWIDTLRKQNRLVSCSMDELADLSGGYEDQTSLEVEAAMERLLTRLTGQQRLVFLLCEAFEYTDREVGELLGISRGAVKATLHRARARLRSKNDEFMAECEDRDAQIGTLQAYMTAFQSADVRALVQLCMDGVVAPVLATRMLLTFSERHAYQRHVGHGTSTSPYLVA